MTGIGWLRAVADKLWLVGVPCSVRELGQRTCGEVLHAEAWADAEHLHKLDKTIDRLAKPEWLPKSIEEAVQHAVEGGKS